LSANATAAHLIDLAWSDNSTNEASFEVERCTGAGCNNFSLLTSVSAGTEAYPDASVAANTTYCYRVRATNIVSPSAYTNIDCATTPILHLYLPISMK
jgi:titin